MATIINQANLTYTYGTTTASVQSNPAVAERIEAITIEKRVLAQAYRAHTALTYLITVQNNGAAQLQNLAVTDDLGAFTAEGAADPIVPLTYAGPAALYIDGVFSEAPDAAVGESGVTFTIPSLPAGSNALIVYTAAVNASAPLSQGSEITNTASVALTGENASASATVPVGAYADVTIEKQMSPDPIGTGEQMTVTFTIRNAGNIAATDLVLTDDFPVPLSDVAVTVNGASFTDFTFENDRLVLPASAATTLTVPAATFPTGENGAATPGLLTVVLTGTI